MSLSKPCLYGIIAIATLCGGCATVPVVKMPIEESVFKPREKTPHESRVVRIGLRISAEKASVSCAGPIDVKGLVTGNTAQWPAGKHMLTVKGGELSVGGEKLGKKIRLSSALEEEFIQSNQKKFRGTLIVRVSGDKKVTIINELTVDDYLKGVLPREVVPTWPMESLKTQAVASRSYMLSHLGRHNKDGFDLCADVHCQVYGGVDREHPQTSRAVEATRGEILTYEGKPIGAFFHSNCGGQTEKILAVWGSPNRTYLPSRKCHYGKGDPRYIWYLEMSHADILRKLKKGTSVRGSKLKSLRVKKKSISGRAETVTVQTDKGSYNLSGNTFRIALHPEKVRSTLWTRLARTDKGYRLEGRGWGHGVGMCQWGAKGQAEQRRTYQTILQFYYPNTTLTVWKRDRK